MENHQLHPGPDSERSRMRSGCRAGSSAARRFSNGPRRRLERLAHDTIAPLDAVVRPHLGRVELHLGRLAELAASPPDIRLLPPGGARPREHRSRRLAPCGHEGEGRRHTPCGAVYWRR